MAKTRQGESYYRELREAFSRSGKSQREFAQERGIPAGTLSGWLHKLRKLDAARGGKPKRSSRSSRAEGPRGAGGMPAQPFLPVHVVPSAAPTAQGGAGYELVLARGVLRLPSDFDPARVAALLRAAEVTC